MGCKSSFHNWIQRKDYLTSPGTWRMTAWFPFTSGNCVTTVPSLTWVWVTIMGLSRSGFLHHNYRTKLYWNLVMAQYWSVFVPYWNIRVRYWYWKSIPMVYCIVPKYWYVPWYTVPLPIVPKYQMFHNTTKTMDGPD